MWMKNRDESPELRRQSLLIAGLCAFGDMTLLGLALTSSAADHVLGSPLTWLAIVLILAADLALALPARTAGAVAVLHGAVRCGSAVLLWQASGIHDLGIGNAAGLVVAGYRAGAWTAGRRSWVAVGALAVGMTGAQLTQDATIGVGSVVTTIANTALPWLMGRYTTGRAGHIEQVERAAADQRRRARRDLEEALANERGAIARDLHDTISHHVSAIGIHAAAGRLALAPARTNDTRTAQARHSDHEPAALALAQVERSSQAAMIDLRRMLDFLAGESSDGARQPGLADLDTLVDGSRRAGLRVAVEEHDLHLSDLPQSLQLSAYRIIQEMLTNALRHGDGGLVLSIHQSRQTLSIRAVNAMSDSDTTGIGPGHGLAGIRRRAEVFGGTCTSGPRPASHTWRTHVVLPLDES